MDLTIKKQVLRMFTYGLYVIMCREQEDVNGFTANWLTQVSFDPSLIALSVENDARSLPMILNTGHFTINVLKSGQKELAGQLGKSSRKHPQKMEGIRYSLKDEQPILDEGLGWIVCRVQKSIEAGDSTLILAEVIDAGLNNEDKPLTMAETGFKHAG